MHPSFAKHARRAFAALLCTAAFVASGCHNYNYNSGIANVWVTVTDEPGDFASYVINIDSITLTRTDGYVASVMYFPETVDFVKLSNVAELWGTGQVPYGTYVQASITLDYTYAAISVFKNGQPQKANVVGPNGGPITTVTFNVNLDPNNPLVALNSFAGTAAVRLAVDLNLAASSSINLATNPATVTVNPFMTAALSAADNKLVRVRGPLINSSLNLDTFTVYLRPFYDEYNNLGTVTLFNDANTITTLNGATYVGSAGINAISQASAGTTVVAAYTTYEPTLTPTLIPPVTAGIFHTKYLIGGSTLEDFFTQGLGGEVVARNGDTLTLRGSTGFYNQAALFFFNDTDTQVTIGPKTKVTADGSAVYTNLDYQSISVGQHIEARGVATFSPVGNGSITALDASSTSPTAPGSVRLLPTSLWGTLLGTGTGQLTLNLSSFDDYPVSNYTFTGNGSTAATNSNPASYVVNTGSIALPPSLTVGGPVWIDGITAPFGSAPPDFIAYDVNAESSVPASLEVSWSAATKTPFSTLSTTAMAIDLGNASVTSALLRVGPESVDLHTLPASPQIVPRAASATTSGLPPVFAPLFAVGNALNGINCYGVFSTYTQTLSSTLAGTGAVQFQASGLYDRSTNTFNASSINVVL